MGRIRYTLIQCRRPSDLMLMHELDSFLEALGAKVDEIECINIAEGSPRASDLDNSDIVMVGGAGDFGVIDDEPWLDELFDWLRELCEMKKPLFCSCYGFQALTQALGGEIVHDPKNAEVGSITASLTGEGRDDELFGGFPSRFHVQVGHKDRATKLPEGALHLVTSEKSPHEAFKIPGSPIYATQFHPELSMKRNRERFIYYLAKYTGNKVGQTEQQIFDSFRESKEADRLMRNYVRMLKQKGIV